MSTINIGTHPSDESKKEGESVTLSVEATPQNDPDFGANGILTYQWERRNKRTGEFVPIRGATDASLTISSLSASDDNDYRCIVKNTYKSIIYLNESLVKTSYGSESVLVDDEYHIGYRSFTLRTEPSDIYTIYPQAESIDISDITPGQISGLKITDSGSGYIPATYTGVSLTGGSGSGAVADIVVADINIRTILKSQGSGYADDFYPDTPLMADNAASGTGARADLLITDGKLRKVMITNSGSSYTSNDLLLLEKPIQSVTQANPAVVTCQNHGLTTGDEIHISRVGGMTDINSETTTITVLTSNTFELDGVDSSLFNAAIANTGYASVIGVTGNNAELQIVSLEKEGVQSVTIVDSGEGYSLGDVLSADSGDIGGGSDFEVEISSINTTITTTTAHNLSVTDVVGVDDVSGMTEINQLFGTITEIPSSTTAVLNIDSSGFTAYTSGGYIQPQITTTVSLGTINPLYITSNPS